MQTHTRGAGIWGREAMFSQVSALSSWSDVSLCSKCNCLGYFSIAVMKHHEQGAYKSKNWIWLWFQKVRTMVPGWRNSWECTTWSTATRQKEREKTKGTARAFWILKAHPLWHTFSNKAPSLNPSPTVYHPESKHKFTYMSLWESF